MMDKRIERILRADKLMVSSVSKFLGMSVDDVRRRIASGELKASNDGRTVNRVDLQSWLGKHRATWVCEPRLISVRRGCDVGSFGQY